MCVFTENFSLEFSSKGQQVLHLTNLDSSLLVLHIKSSLYLRPSVLSWFLKPNVNLVTTLIVIIHTAAEFFNSFNLDFSLAEKFTFSKSHFSQNSHFQSLLFHKIHIFEMSFFTKVTFFEISFYTKFIALALRIPKWGVTPL